MPPEHHFEGGKRNPDFRTKSKISFELVGETIEGENRLSGGGG